MGNKDKKSVSIWKAASVELPLPESTKYRNPFGMLATEYVWKLAYERVIPVKLGTVLTIIEDGQYLLFGYVSSKREYGKHRVQPRTLDGKAARLRALRETPTIGDVIDGIVEFAEFPLQAIDDHLNVLYFGEQNVDVMGLVLERHTFTPHRSPHLFLTPSDYKLRQYEAPLSVNVGDISNFSP